MFKLENVVKGPPALVLGDSDERMRWGMLMLWGELGADDWITTKHDSGAMPEGPQFKNIASFEEIQK